MDAKIGEILVQKGQIRRYQLDFALRLQNSYRKLSQPRRLGELLVAHRGVSQRIVDEALRVQKELPREPITQIINSLEESDGDHTKLLTLQKL